MDKWPLLRVMVCPAWPAILGCPKATKQRDSKAEMTWKRIRHMHYPLADSVCVRADPAKVEQHRHVGLCTWLSIPLSNFF